MICAPHHSRVSTLKVLDDVCFFRQLARDMGVKVFIWDVRDVVNLMS